MGEKGELLQVLGQWPITPQQVSPYKDVYKVQAVEGLYCLKEIDKKPRRALALEGVMEHLLDKGFTKTAMPQRGREGRILCQSSSGRHYILTDWLVGRRPVFRTLDEDILGATTTLALFHEASSGFVAPSGGKLRNRLKRWPSRFTSRLREVVKLREELNHKPFLDNFDRAFVDYFPWILDRAQEGWGILATSQYDSLVEAARKSRSFCHGDVAQRNFVVTGLGEYHIIDLDLTRRDIRVADLYKLFRDVMKKRRWDFRVARLILEGYSEVSLLGPEELSVLYALLCYPHKIIHLLLRYYVKREGKSYSWSTRKFIEKLHELGQQRDMIDTFLETFKSEYDIK
ncbi:MAG: CotS family spore coat protein [Firmicutes bacterium]|nr:CotS family spore coat protein [Bacillota bacterium]